MVFFEHFAIGLNLVFFFKNFSAKWNCFCNSLSHSLNYQIRLTLSCRIQTPGLLLGLVMEFPPLFFTKPWVFSFSHPWLLSCPWFSLFPTLGCYSALGFPLFPSLATIQPLVFHFYPPLAIIPPWACIQQVRVPGLRLWRNR